MKKALLNTQNKKAIADTINQDPQNTKLNLIREQEIDLL